MKNSAIFSAIIFVLFLCFSTLPAQAGTSHQQSSSTTYTQTVQKHHHKASARHSRHHSRHHHAARTSSSRHHHAAHTNLARHHHRASASSARHHHTARHAQTAQPLQKAGDTTHGLAAWYGGKDHHQKMTSSGERFDHNAMTAAHRTLPFGSLVKVTNLRNNKSVVVRVTDRGPYSKKLSIDLSKGAAEKIGMLEAGIGHVKMELVRLGRG